jgi:hypothetical protein
MFKARLQSDPITAPPRKQAFDAVSTSVPRESAERDRTPLTFWMLGAALVCYVAVCTPQRANLWGADAWEHHRVLKALVRDLTHPGNPTYAVDVPSVRYSPYFVVQAVSARWLGIDPYVVLSAAAVINTAFLVFAIWALLASFDEKGSAAAVLVAVVGLYWVPPGYANSLALADLPWLQVNPSAWSFAWAVLSWAISKRSLDRGRAAVWIALPLAMCLLDHAMTALFAFLGLGVIAITRPDRRRWVWTATVFLMAAAALGIGAAWPWFRLIDAIRWSSDRDYWFNAAILRLTLGEWCVPGYICGLAALTRLDRDLVRVGLTGGALATLLGISSFVTKSPVTARLPIAGTLLFAIATGIFIHRSGAMALGAWRERLKLLRADHRVTAETALALAVLLLLAYGLIPQCVAVFREPWLGRIYVARLLHKSDKQQDVKQMYDRLLSGVGTNDVVLSDTLTSWPVPSSNGKIVAALHYELFVTDQAGRTADVTRFFSPSESTADRIAILDKYATRWILLNRRVLDAEVFKQLLEPSAIVAREKDLYLMDAQVWRRDESSHVSGSRRLSPDSAN